MDSISDSDSEDAGSIPAGATLKGWTKKSSSFAGRSTPRILREYAARKIEHEVIDQD